MKKFIVLAAAIAAVAMLIVPAGASAYTSKWKMEGSELASNGTLTLSGTAKFSGGTTCPVHAHITLEAGTGTGSITQFEPYNLSECAIEETLKSLGCSALTSSTAENLPYMADDQGTYVKISAGSSGPIKLTNHYTGGAFCPTTVTLEEKSGEEIRATPDSTTAATKFTLSGTIHTSLGTTATISGTLNAITGSGTYGL